MKRYFVAITGASGSPYAIRAVNLLLEMGGHVTVAVTGTAMQVMSGEVPQLMNVRKEEFLTSLKGLFNPGRGILEVVGESDFSVPYASGSNPPDGMVIVPCSMGTLGRIASGVSGNLIERGADVALKEKKPLVLVVRETPLNLIHLKNMERLLLSGAVIMPASPGFYGRPERIEELIDFIVERALKLMGAPVRQSTMWGEKEVNDEEDPGR